MVALREHPVPKTQLDSSIFEVSEDDEYRSVAESFKHSITPTTPVTTNSSGFSSLSLLQLVRRYDYTSANRVRTEMVQHHLSITPDHIFIEPAIHAVNSPLDSVMKLKEFSEWLSLLPIADEETRSRPMFGRLVYLLSNGPRVDVDLVMAFVRICVSKGYMVKIPDQMIPLVVRSAPPSTSLKFLEDLRSSVAENFALDKQMKRKIRFWCKAAMTEYLGIGLVEEAVKTFQMGLQYGPSLPRVPSRRLGKAVSKDPDHFRLSEETIAALKPPKVHLTHYRGPSRRRDPISDIPSALNPIGFDTDPSDPKALLSRVWETIHSAKPAAALDVARFLEIFDLDPTAIQVLSAYNQRKPIRHRGQWILGEMLYYARREEWGELIGAFDTHFFRIGVPRNIEEHKSQGRVTALNVQKRLFPSPFHTSLVWMALVEILQGARPVSMLFQELVEQATAAKTRKCAQMGLSVVPVPTGMFDVGHFDPFLVAAYREQRYKRLVAVFGEMDRLGIKPGVKQLSLLAGAYAGMSEGHEAVRILDRMEGVLKEGTYRTSRYVDLYMPALRGFIARNDTSGASLARRRILDRGYVGGTSLYVDRMLAKAKVHREVAN